MIFGINVRENIDLKSKVDNYFRVFDFIEEYKCIVLILFMNIYIFFLLIEK